MLRYRTTLATVALLVTFLGGYVIGQRDRSGPPPANVGQSEEVLRSLDLTNELESGKGRPLRMRKMTMAPGGAMAVHTHAGRPAVAYMLQGEMTYHQDGRPDVTVGPGGSF